MYRSGCRTIFESLRNSNPFKTTRLASTIAACVAFDYAFDFVGVALDEQGVVDRGADPIPRLGRRQQASRSISAPLACIGKFAG